MRTCFICGEKVDNELCKDIFGNNVICISCYTKESNNNNLGNCEICNSITPYDMMDEVGNGEYYESACPTCFKHEYGRYSHDYKPAPIFHHWNNENRENSLHFGVELEVEGQEGWEFINDQNNSIDERYFYFKCDGSLDDENGVEIVSHPMTLPVALIQWKKMFDIINKYQLDNLNNCGLHIHLDKKYLNERQLRNIDYIVNNFTKTIYEIGGRDININEWSIKTIKNIMEWGHDVTEDKYRAVHFCKNTIELRCFNSTVDWEAFKFIIVAVRAIVEMANIHSFNYFYKMSDEKFTKSFLGFYKRFVNKNLIK